MLDLTSTEKIVVTVGFIFALIVTLIMYKRELAWQKSKRFEAVVLRIAAVVGCFGGSFGFFVAFAMLFGFWPW